MLDTRSMYVADTHALAWYLSRDKKLSAKARKALNEVRANESILVIPAVVWPNYS